MNSDQSGHAAGIDISIVMKITTLTAHNWQNFKRVFLSGYCYDIYRVEEVSQKYYNNTLKITVFVKFGEISLKINNSAITV